MSSSSFLARDPALANFCTLRSALPMAVPIFTATRASLLFLAIVILHNERSHPIPERFQVSLNLTGWINLPRSRLDPLSQAAIPGCVSRSRQKSRCTAQAQTAEEGVHQFPLAAHRLERCTRWFRAAHCSSAPFE